MKSLRISALIFIFCLVFSKVYSQPWIRYTDSGKYYQSQRMFPKAIRFFVKAKDALPKDSISTATYAACIKKLAVAYEVNHQYDKSGPLFYLELTLRQKLVGKHHPDYAASCYNLATHYEHTGYYLHSVQRYGEARSIFGRLPENERSENIGKYIASCVGLAKLYEKIGQYENAASLFREVNQSEKNIHGDQSAEYAKSCYDLAELYKSMGRFDDAEQLYIEAMQVRQVAGMETPEYARSCLGLADFYVNIGLYDKADSLYREAKGIQEQLNMTEEPDYATTCDNFGVLYWYEGRYEDARQLLLKSLGIRKKIMKNDPSIDAYNDYAFSCGNLSNLYTSYYHYDQAVVLEKKGMAIEAAKIGKNQPDYATFCFNLADLYAETGKYRKAEPLFLLAKQIELKTLGKNHPDYGASCFNLGCLYRAMHKPLLAEANFKEAFSVSVHNLSAIFQFTNEKEKTAFIKNKFGEDYLAYSFYASSKRESGQAYNLTLLHRNLILSSLEATKKEILSSGDTTLIKKYTEWLNEKKLLAFLYSIPRNERKEDIADIETRADRLEKELNRASKAFRTQEQKTTWKDVRQHLRPGEASIEFVAFNYNNGKRWTDSTYYAALLLRNDLPAPEFIRLFEKRQLDEVLEHTKASSDSTRINMLYRGNPALYDLTWKPIVKYLKGIKKIYFAPAGQLFKISFAALPINRTQILADKFQLVQLNSTAAIGENNERIIKPGDKLQLYGGIRYSSAPVAAPIPAKINVSYNFGTSYRIDSLPGTLLEIREIEAEARKWHFQVTALTGANATEESIKLLDGPSSPSILHIATHGFFLSDPQTDHLDNYQQQFEPTPVFRQATDPLLRSGLYFAGAENALNGKYIKGTEDGILTAYEVSNLYLPNTKLVVLSACETGLGDVQGSEGIYGLQRAFKIAGVQNLVMSLWKIPDSETAEFMENFYGSLFAGQTISKAFQDTQLFMKNKYPSDPYQWAGWVLVK